MSLTGNCGRVALVDKSVMPCALNQRVAALRVKDFIIPRFLFHVFNSYEFEEVAMSSANGAGQKI